VLWSLDAMRACHLFVMGSLLGGCATAPHPSYVQPTERVLAVMPSGEKAAIYDVVAPNGTVATVKIWSNGVDAGEVDGQERTLFHVGLEVTSTAGGPVQIRTPGLRIDGDLAPVRSTRDESVDVAAGETRVVETYFASPPSVAPQSVDHFVFHWALDAQGGTYQQATTFTADPSLGVTQVVRRFHPASEQRRHPKVVIRDGRIVQ
jgi:hypothetical protein